MLCGKSIIVVLGVLILFAVGATLAQVPGPIKPKVDVSLADALKPGPKWIANSLQITPADPKKGDAVTFKARFKLDRVSASMIHIQGRISGAIVYDTNMVNPPQDVDVWVNFVWAAVIGSYKVEIVLDPEKRIPDNYPPDNTISRNFTVVDFIPGVTHAADLKLENVVWPASIPRGSDHFFVGVTVKNVGTLTAGPSKLDVNTKTKMRQFSDEVLDGDGWANVPSLEVNQIWTGSIRIDTDIIDANYQYYKIVVRADGNNQVQEKDEGNNYAEKIIWIN